ncbi:MAG: hypothetical protein RL385_3281 [Pseudomonadota bacterium]|jgi:hypothetical protein
MTLGIAGALGWAAFQASAAQAAAPVVVPPRDEPNMSDDALDVAVAELMRVLKVQGFDAISPGQAGPVAEQAQRAGQFPKDKDPFACVTPECAADYRQIFDAAFAVQLRLVREGGKVRQLGVVLTESPRVYFTGLAVVEGLDVRGAVRRALETARRKQADGEGPWLTVAGTPPGALVFVDGQEFGRVPLARRQIVGGSHVVEIRDQHHVAARYALVVPSEIDHEHILQVSLAPFGEAQPEASLDKAWDWALGGTLFIAGAAHLVGGVVQQAKRGDCAERSDGACTLFYGDESGVSRERLLMGLGAAGMALGAAVAWFAPIGHLRLSAERGRAALSWQRSF